MPVTFAIIVPTIGRATLDRTLASIASQNLVAGDEVIVVGDGPQPEAREYVANSQLASATFFEIPKSGGWGGPCRTAGMAVAKATNLMFVDDDDYYLPGAIDLARRVVEAYPSRPIIFRVALPSGILLWADHHARLANIGTSMLVVPNDKLEPDDAARLPVWGNCRDSDGRWGCRVIGNYGGDDAVVWREEALVQHSGDGWGRRDVT